MKNDSTKGFKALHRKNCLTPKEIDGYLGGNFSGFELQKIEWHISECPLCSDAIEGFEADKNHKAVFISDKLGQKFMPNKPQFLTLNAYKNMAAAIVLFTFIGILWFTFGNKEDFSQMQKEMASPTTMQENKNDITQVVTGKNEILQKESPKLSVKSDENVKMEEKSTAIVKPDDIAFAKDEAPIFANKEVERPNLASSNASLPVNDEKKATDEDVMGENADDSEENFSDEHGDIQLEKESLKSEKNLPSKKRANNRDYKPNESKINDSLVEKQSAGKTQIQDKNELIWRNAELYFAQKKFKKAKKELLKLKKADKKWHLQADSLLKFLE